MPKKKFALFIPAIILLYAIFIAACKSSHSPLTAEKLFLEKCAPCHGPQGKGNGPAAGPLNPKPRDFTTDQWKFGGSKEQIMRTITDGSPGTAMSSWKDSLSSEQIEQMADYVLNFSQKTD